MKKQAYQVRATVDGKSWMTRGTTLTAANETEAKEKAAKVLRLTSEHSVQIIPVEVYASTEKLTASNYPYGRLKTTAFFSVEYNGKKGMRTTFQTIDPKNGRINKPKHSTYYPVILPMIDLNSGHCDFCGYLDFNGTEKINKGLQFMHDFQDLFTPEQIKDIALYILAMTKVNIKAQVMYCGSSFDDLKPLYDEQIKNIVTIANTAENLFLSSLLDFDKIEALKVPDFNPFTIKTATIGA
jgi:hypothetical protein